jgi:hypothetical protein
MDDEVGQPVEILTTHRLRLDGVAAPRAIERLRAVLPQYLTELQGLHSAELYRSPDGLDVLLLGRWHAFADVARSLAAVYAKQDLGLALEAESFMAYALVARASGDDVRR